MDKYRVDIDLAQVDADSVFQNQTLGGAGNFVLDGAGVVSGKWISPDSFAHKISFESAGNLSALTFTITGYSDKSEHNLITEQVTGPNATTVDSTKYFYSITSIASDGAVGTNVQSGFADEAVTDALPLNYWGGVVSVNLDITGVIDVTIQNTFDVVQDINNLDFTWQDSPSTRFVNATSSTNDAYDGIPTALRLKINSYSFPTQGSKLTIIQRQY